MTQFFKNDKGAIILGNHIITKGTFTAEFIGDSVKIFPVGNTVDFYYFGKVTDIEFKVGGSFIPCTGVEDFIDKSSDFFANPLDLKADLVGGKIPAEQLPAYVDDVINIEYFSDTEPIAQEDELWYDTITDTLSVLQNDEWIDVDMDYGRIYVNVDQTSDSYNSTFRYNGVKLILLGANVTREFLEQMLVTRTLDLSAYNIDMSLADDFTKLTNGASSVFTISNPIIKKPFRLFISGGTLGTPLFTGYTATWKASTLQSDYNPAVVMVLCCEIRSSGQITLFWEN